MEGSEEFESGGFAGPPQAVEVGLVGGGPPGFDGGGDRGRIGGELVTEADEDCSTLVVVGEVGVATLGELGEAAGRCFTPQSEQGPAGGQQEGGCRHSVG